MFKRSVFSKNNCGKIERNISQAWCCTHMHETACNTSWSSIWSRGGPRNFFWDFADVLKRSRASEASQYWPGSRACLKALEAFAFLTIRYAFSHFSWYFFFKFFMYICVGTLQNIYFNMKDSGHFDKCNFWFPYLRKSRVLVVHLV